MVAGVEEDALEKAHLARAVARPRARHHEHQRRLAFLGGEGVGEGVAVEERARRLPVGKARDPPDPLRDAGRKFRLVRPRGADHRHEIGIAERVLGLRRAGPKTENQPDDNGQNGGEGAHRRGNSTVAGTPAMGLGAARRSPEWASAVPAGATQAHPSPFAGSGHNRVWTVPKSRFSTPAWRQLWRRTSAFWPGPTSSAGGSRDALAGHTAGHPGATIRPRPAPSRAPSTPRGCGQGGAGARGVRADPGDG